MDFEMLRQTWLCEVSRKDSRQYSFNKEIVFSQADCYRNRAISWRFYLFPPFIYFASYLYYIIRFEDEDVVLKN